MKDYLIFLLAMTILYLPLALGVWIMVPESWRFQIGFYPIFLTVMSVIKLQRGKY